jgi:hypothetical protein
MGVQGGLRQLAAHSVQTWSTQNPAYIHDFDTFEDIEALKMKRLEQTVSWPAC